MTAIELLLFISVVLMGSSFWKSHKRLTQKLQSFSNFQSFSSWTGSLSVTDVREIIETIAQSHGVLQAPAGSRMGRSLCWYGKVFNRAPFIIESELKIWVDDDFGTANEHLKQLVSSSPPKDVALVSLRWLMADTATAIHMPLTEITCEWTFELGSVGNISILTQVVTHLDNNLKRELAKKDMANRLLGGGWNAPQQSASASAIPAVIPATGARASVSVPGAMSRQSGTVTAPVRHYENIDWLSAQECVKNFLSSGGTLLDPIGGALSLRWHVHELDCPKPGVVSAKILFSDYSPYSSAAELSNELLIRWHFKVSSLASSASKSRGVELSVVWDGVLGVSTGDLVRLLLDLTERQLFAAGAELPLSVSHSSLRQIQAGNVNNRAAHRAPLAHEQPVVADETLGPDEHGFIRKRVRKPAASRVFWPNPQDYNETIQSPSICFDDLELRSGSVEMNRLGLPKVATGAFASVYRVSCGDSDYAVRCFSSQVKDQEDRYFKTSRFICSDDLPYTVPLQYIARGIRVHDSWFPILKMEWVEGISLYAYVEKHLADLSKMQRLRENFATMMSDLRAAGIAHSDLQHGNIIMRGEEIVLVDYDGMFVPELSGYLSLERGHPNYQHPDREARHFGPYLDNFSAWLIDTALMALIEDKSLWRKFSGDCESLLFKRADLMQPAASELFAELQSKSAELCERARFLESLLSARIEQIPHLQDGCPALLESQFEVNESAHIERAESRADHANSAESTASEGSGGDANWRPQGQVNKGLPDWML